MSITDNPILKKMLRMAEQYLEASDAFRRLTTIQEKLRLAYFNQLFERNPDPDSGGGAPVPNAPPPIVDMTEQQRLQHTAVDIIQTFWVQARGIMWKKNLQLSPSNPQGLTRFERALYEFLKMEQSHPRNWIDDFSPARKALEEALREEENARASESLSSNAPTVADSSQTAGSAPPQPQPIPPVTVANDGASGPVNPNAVTPIRQGTQASDTSTTAPAPTDVQNINQPSPTKSPSKEIGPTLPPAAIPDVHDEVHSDEEDDEDMEIDVVTVDDDVPNNEEGGPPTPVNMELTEQNGEQQAVSDLEASQVVDNIGEEEVRSACSTPIGNGSLPIASVQNSPQEAAEKTTKEKSPPALINGGSSGQISPETALPTPAPPTPAPTTPAESTPALPATTPCTPSPTNPAPTTPDVSTPAFPTRASPALIPSTPTTTTPPPTNPAPKTPDVSTPAPPTGSPTTPAGSSPTFPTPSPTTPDPTTPASTTPAPTTTTPSTPTPATPTLPSPPSIDAHIPDPVEPGLPRLDGPSSNADANIYLRTFLVRVNFIELCRVAMEIGQKKSREILREVQNPSKVIDLRIEELRSKNLFEWDWTPTKIWRINVPRLLDFLSGPPSLLQLRDGFEIDTAVLELFANHGPADRLTIYRHPQFVIDVAALCEAMRSDMPKCREALETEFKVRETERSINIRREERVHLKERAIERQMGLPRLPPNSPEHETRFQQACEFSETMIQELDEEIKQLIPYLKSKLFDPTKQNHKMPQKKDIRAPLPHPLYLQYNKEVNSIDWSKSDVQWVKGKEDRDENYVQWLARTERIDQLILEQLEEGFITVRGRLEANIVDGRGEVADDGANPGRDGRRPTRDDEAMPPGLGGGQQDEPHPDDSVHRRPNGNEPSTSDAGSENRASRPIDISDPTVVRMYCGFTPQPPPKKDDKLLPPNTTESSSWRRMTEWRSKLEFKVDDDDRVRLDHKVQNLLVPVVVLRRSKSACAYEQSSRRALGTEDGGRAPRPLNAIPNGGEIAEAPVNGPINAPDAQQCTQSEQRKEDGKHLKKEFHKALKGAKENIPVLSKDDDGFDERMEEAKKHCDQAEVYKNVLLEPIKKMLFKHVINPNSSYTQFPHTVTERNPDPRHLFTTSRKTRGLDGASSLDQWNNLKAAESEEYWTWNNLAREIQKEKIEQIKKGYVISVPRERKKPPQPSQTSDQAGSSGSAGQDDDAQVASTADGANPSNKAGPSDLKAKKRSVKETGGGGAAEPSSKRTKREKVPGVSQDSEQVAAPAVRGSIADDGQGGVPQAAGPSEPPRKRMRRAGNGLDAPAVGGVPAAQTDGQVAQPDAQFVQQNAQDADAQPRGAAPVRARRGRNGIAARNGPRAAGAEPIQRVRRPSVSSLASRRGGGIRGGARRGQGGRGGRGSRGGRGARRGAARDAQDDDAAEPDDQDEEIAMEED